MIHQHYQSTTVHCWTISLLYVKMVWHTLHTLQLETIVYNNKMIWGISYCLVSVKCANPFFFDGKKSSNDFSARGSVKLSLTKNHLVPSPTLSQNSSNLLPCPELRKSANPQKALAGCQATQRRRRNRWFLINKSLTLPLISTKSLDDFPHTRKNSRSVERGQNTYSILS